MGLLQKCLEKKPEFYRIFDKAKHIDFITAGGKLSYDELIDTHLSAWTASRINGISASMAFYAEETEAIILIDKIAKEYFS